MSQNRKIVIGLLTALSNCIVRANEGLPVDSIAARSTGMIPALLPMLKLAPMDKLLALFQMVQLMPEDSDAWVLERDAFDTLSTRLAEDRNYSRVMKDARDFAATLNLKQLSLEQALMQQASDPSQEAPPEPALLTDSDELVPISPPSSSSSRE